MDLSVKDIQFSNFLEDDTFHCPTLENLFGKHLYLDLIKNINFDDYWKFLGLDFSKA